MINRNICGRGVVLAFVLSASVSIHALAVTTHRLVNFAAADYSRLDQYIRESLGFAAGRAAVLRAPSMTARDLLAEGGEREDDGGPFTGRFHNHFHNPLRPWGEAGLHLFGHKSSSVRWMQDPQQAPGGHWAWADARQFYLRALTHPEAGTRERAAADLFRTLGQVMHLVVDASVPEHTRDDPHPFGGVVANVLKRRQAGSYEYWVSDSRQAGLVASLLANPIGFDPSILSIPPPAGETVATVPIARLIDTDRYAYHGSSPPNPNVTLGGGIGLAEFANANFFSEDTLHGRFPFPSLQGLTASPQKAPKGSAVRAYLAKPPGQGLPTSVALAECVTERSVGRWIVNASPPYPCVDEAVWQETATHMLPRAVGYARGVLDYFFRGKLAMELIVPVTFNDDDNPRWPYTEGILLGVRNNSSETMSGSFEVYRGGSSQSRRKAISATGTHSGAPGELIVMLLEVLPPGAPREHVLVFRGRLGSEEDAVASYAFVVP